MDTKQVLKKIINTASDCKKEKNYEPLVQSLLVLSATDDLSVFDSGSIEMVELYILMHELLSHHPAESDVVAAVLEVTQVVVRNPDACQALAHTYHLLYPLTSLLDSHLPLDKRLAILQIIQELSYGAVIYWQEAHLPRLMRILLETISSDNGELITVALNVLVNLCHKNKAAVFTLVNCIDLKVFLRKILNLQRENVETSVQVCKLVMVLDNLSGNVPDTQILSFVKVSFINAVKAFHCSNVSLLRQIVSFFRDASRSEHGKKILLTYPNYQEDTNNLINILVDKEVPNNWQCVQQLVDFLQQLINLELPTIIPMMPQMIACLLPWVQVEGVAPGALDLISAVVCQCRSMDSEIYKSICSSLSKNLQMLIEMLHSRCRTECTRENRLLLTSLLHLFRELAGSHELLAFLVSNIDKDELKQLLLPLMVLSSHDGIHLFQQSITSLYVEVLSFVSELSMNDMEWLYLYSDLLQKRQIMQALAVALYSGPYEVKHQILCLASTTPFSKDCVTVLSRCLTDLNQLFQSPPPTTNLRSEKDSFTSGFQSQLEFSLPFTKTQKQGLDHLIEKLDDLFKNNKLETAGVAGIVELYQYKLGEMRRAEQSVQASLAAADHFNTQQSHRVAHLTAETNRLHQMLYQTLQNSQLELAELRQQLTTAQETAHVKFKQLKQDVHSKSMIIKDQQDDITNMKQTIEERVKKCGELEQKISILVEEREEKNLCIQKLEAEKLGLQTANSKLEEKLQERDQMLLQKESLLEKKSNQAKSLEKECSSLKLQLVELEKMRKAIFEISAGGKKNNL